MDEELLKTLATDYCSLFLSVKDKDGEPLEKIIGLCGADDEILIQLKDRMEKYFQKNGKKVQINLDNNGYSINVGKFLSL